MHDLLACRCFSTFAHFGTLTAKALSGVALEGEKHSQEEPSGPRETSPYLFFQPVVVLHNASHHHVSALHIEGDLSCWFILKLRSRRVKVGPLLAHLEWSQQAKWWGFLHNSHKNVCAGSGLRSIWPSILSQGQKEMPIQLQFSYLQQEFREVWSAS